LGFAQCQLRHDYVEGTKTSPVAYLEGIFIKKEYRLKNLARDLLSNCEKWAIQNNCTEIASDCEIDNNISFEFHKK
jgi:aminoglycoside 6'-N-acetyltransferase I